LFTASGSVDGIIGDAGVEKYSKLVVLEGESDPEMGDGGTCKVIGWRWGLEI